MSEKRFIRNIAGDIYDSETDKWFEEDWESTPLDYEDDLIVFLNEQEATIKQLQGKVKRLNAFIVEQGLAIEYLKWNKKGDLND